MFYSGKLWVGGSFGHAGTGAATNIAIWDPAGQAWSRVGGGLNYNGSVYALAGLPAPNQHFVVIGGGFSQVDDGNATGTGTKYATVNGLVYFDTSATITGPLDGYYTMGGGVTTNCGSTPPCSGTVYAVLVDGIKAYVGGNFDDAGTIASRSFAEFDMSAGTWSSPGVVGGGSAFGPQVNALVNVGGTYFLGGDFTSAGAINANYVASYTPATTTWSALGSGVSGVVNALAQTSDGLYVGGAFSVAGVNPSQNLALWTATKVGPVGTTTALASSSNPSTTGQSVTYTATVTPLPDGGTVAFTDNTATVTGCGAVVVSTVTGKATCTTSSTATGSHSIAATYSGNADFTTSKGTLTQQVNAPLSTGGLGTLTAVSTDSTTDGWAVGSYINPSTHARQTLTQRWNGAGWTTVASPNVGGTTSAANVTTLNAVSTRSASDAWAVGTYTDPATQARKTLILHWNGTGWSTLTSPNPGGVTGSTSVSVLTGVTADSATDAWAVGYFTSPGTGATETLTVHWNGTTWTTVASPNPGGTAAGQSTQLYAASATAPGDVWAAGSVTDPATQAVETLALHWDGTTWSAVATPSLGGTTGSTQRSTLSGISANSPTDAWAVGTFTNRTTRAVEALAMRWNGTSWTSVVTPEPGGTSSSADVTTLSAVSAELDHRCVGCRQLHQPDHAGHANGDPALERHQPDRCGEPQPRGNRELEPVKRAFRRRRAVADGCLGGRRLHGGQEAAGALERHEVEFGLGKPTVACAAGDGRAGATGPRLAAMSGVAEDADERSPVRVGRPSRVRDHLVGHHDPAASVRGRRRVVTPSACWPEAGLAVARKAVLRSGASAVHVDGSQRRSALERHEGGARIQRRPGDAEGHRPVARLVEPDGGVQQACGATRGHVALVGHRPAAATRGHAEPGDARAVGGVVRPDSGVQRGEELAVHVLHLLHAVVVDGDHGLAGAQ